jgi:phage shock protein A
MSDELLRKMESSLARQLSLLEGVRSGIAEITRSRQSVGEGMAELQALTDKLGQQAEKALLFGRQDLAELAWSKQATALSQLSPLKAQHAQLRSEEDSLMQASSALEAKIAAYQARVKARKVLVGYPEPGEPYGASGVGISGAP